MSYVADWYDSLGRRSRKPTTEPPSHRRTSPRTVPLCPSDPTAPLATTNGYDGYGNQNLTIDPDGTQTLQVFNSLGDAVYTIDNYDSSLFGTTNGQIDYRKPLPGPATPINHGVSTTRRANCSRRPP